MWSNFDILVLLDILQRFLQREYGGRDDAGLVVRTAGAYVGQLLGLAHVDDKVNVVHVLANYLSGIYLVLRLYEELASVLQVVYGIGIGIAAFQSYQ